jgi:ribosomal protein S18 acetylase RimI-like enzyme
MAIITRRAAPADAAELHELAARTFGLANPAGTRQADIDAFIAEHLARASFEKYLADPGRILLLAEEEGVPVGYSMLITGPIADPGLAAIVESAAGSPADTAIELSKFYIAEQRHGSGAAGTLMTATLAAAVGTGARICWLGVNQHNERAARFYARHGFEILGTKRFLVGTVWQDDHVRARSL